MFPRSLSRWFLPLLLVAGGPPLVGAQESSLGPPEAEPFAALPELPDCVPHGHCQPDVRLPFNDPPAEREFRMVWGIVGASGDCGERTAPNGLVGHPLYTIDIDFNIWLWPAQRLYLYDDTLFWMDSTHKGLNFTKRELDLEVGLAWNYYDRLEARLFGYAQNNLNRGTSLEDPDGYNDGCGVENRFYLSPIYSALGTSGFDQAKATFVSLGYYPTKTFTGADGQQFFPSLFARAYLTWDLFKDCCYLYADTILLAERKPFNAKLLESDVGAALRPFQHVPRLEFRAGCQDVWDMQVQNARPVGYFSIRYIF